MPRRAASSSLASRYFRKGTFHLGDPGSLCKRGTVSATSDSKRVVEIRCRCERQPSRRPGPCPPLWVTSRRHTMPTGDGQRYVCSSRVIADLPRTRHWFSSTSEPPDSYVLIVMLAIWYVRFLAAPIRV